MLSQIELLKKYGLRIRGHLGQHLLMDPNTIRKIVDSLDLREGDRVFEIGPGLGAVTQEVLRRGFSLLAVETDRKFVEILTTELAPEYFGKFTLVHADVLKCDLTKLVREWFETGTGAFSATERRTDLSSGGLGIGAPAEGGEPDPLKKVSQSPIKVIGNLPYYISTPILFHLIEHADVFSSAVMMLQKEVAARLTARAGDEDYGRLSVTSRLYGETEFLFDVSPKCFLPPPEVTSRVVRYMFRKNLKPGGKKFLLEIVKIAFSQRRKTLLSLLAHDLKPKRDRKDCECIFRDLGFSPKVRGETLSLEQFMLLSAALEATRATGNGERCC